MPAHPDRRWSLIEIRRYAVISKQLLHSAVQAISCPRSAPLSAGIERCVQLSGKEIPTFEALRTDHLAHNALRAGVDGSSSSHRKDGIATARIHTPESGSQLPCRGLSPNKPICAVGVREPPLLRMRLITLTPYVAINEHDATRPVHDVIGVIPVVVSTESWLLVLLTSPTSSRSENRVFVSSFRLHEKHPAESSS